MKEKKPTTMLLRWSLILISLLLPQLANAQPAPAKKAAASVFTLTTYKADGTILSTSHGVFAGSTGVGLAPWNAFVGADRGIIIDAKGKQYDIDAMLGASDLYDLCTFRVKNYRESNALPLTTSNAPAATVYVAEYATKNAPVRAIQPVRTEKFMTDYNYYVFNDVDISSTDLGCPIVNAEGQLLGILQRPANGGQAFSTDARFITTFQLKGFSINDPTLRATGIRTALPDTEEEATLMLYLAPSVVDSAKYEQYIDDFIDRFPTATDGYNARANRYYSQHRLAEADDMLQTEVKRAAKKDVAYSNYANMVYQAAVYRVDTTFTQWNLDRALELSQEASKLNPLPVYQHQQAQILYAQGHYQQALDIFLQLQGTDMKGTGEIYYEAAQCKQHLNAPQSEIQPLLDAAVNAQTGYASAPYVLARGENYDSLGEYRKAFRDYMTYDSLMQGNATPEFYYTKFKCEKKIRQYQLAVNDIAHAIVLNRREPVYYAELASLQLQVNHAEDAIRTCNLGLQVASDMSDFYIIRGIALCTTKQKEAGLKDLRQAKTLGDDRADKLIELYSKK